MILLPVAKPYSLKPVNLFVRRDVKTGIQQRDKLISFFQLSLVIKNLIHMVF